MILPDRIKEFISQHADDDIRTLALRSKAFPDIDMQMAIQQISGRKIAKNKIPSWYANEDIIYPKHLSLEQCSSEYTARFKADICNGNSMIDLTGGLGVDIAFISENFNSNTYVEQQKELTNIAKHNFSMLGLNINVVCDDSLNYLKSMDAVDLIYIDPARRDTSGQKTVLIEDCTPNIIEIKELLKTKANRVMIKLSPMLDISLAIKSLNGDVSEVYIISHQNECKELIFIIDKNKSTEAIYNCINIRTNWTDRFSFTREEEETSTIEYTDKALKYLYEPNSAIIKAGAYKSIARDSGLKKLHPSSHLYTSDSFINDFQGRKFIVDNISTLNKKELKGALGTLQKANITTRNFPLTVEEIRKRTKLKDGGDIYIFATTLSDEKKVLIFSRKA